MKVDIAIPKKATRSGLIGIRAMLVIDGFPVCSITAREILLMRSRFFVKRKRDFSSVRTWYSVEPLIEIL